MSELIVWNLVTLDGYFEGAQPWDLSFHDKAWGPELEALSEEFGRKAEALVFGRKTYEGMASYWKTAEPSTISAYMNALPKLVASRTLTEPDWNNTTITADIGREIEWLKTSSTRNVYVFGSAELTHSLLEQGLVDEIILCVVPVLLGQGTLLFKPGTPRGLALVESRSLQNGGVILRYAVGG